MHDIGGAGFIENATAGPDKGWLTDLEYIGTSGNPSVNCHSAETSAGVAIIQRLDVDGSHSFPDASGLAGYVNGFAAYATACPQIHVWIVGNEPNVTVGNSDPATYATPYAAAYVQVRNRIHALSGHQSDLVLMSPASPFSGFCICSMHRIIQEIVRQGGQIIDGFAVHAYTQTSNFNTLVSLVTSDQLASTPDGCGMQFHSHFRIYRDWITALTGEGQAGKPVFITEAGNVFVTNNLICGGGECIRDQNVGYFQAMYQEIRSYNTTHNTKIRAITPYRWSDFHESQSTGFAISTRPSLQADLSAAFQANLSGPVTCDNNVPLNGTACNPSDPGAQFVCTHPGLPSSQQWTRQACATGQPCSGTHCQTPPPTTCDNNVPLNGTACNPSDPGAQFVCTHPGLPSSQQWTRQACPAGQLCGGTHCQATCDNNVPFNGTACNPADPGAQFVCVNPGAPSSQQWSRQACAVGHSCVGTHCQ